MEFTQRFVEESIDSGIWGFFSQANQYFNDLVLSPIVLLFIIHVIFNFSLLSYLGKLKYFFVNFVISFILFLIGAYVIIALILLASKIYRRLKDGRREN